ncbi:hemolysin III family protein [Lysobacter pythonis]|uniref:Hemolysin III family protein n=1 Tax=Solilutibacter pythonis TaxID=2483112 RepID=A0A3M2HS47_9GAMM|nr:hemolysin III family protein [Lysobacter pythonis]RMH88614.1 hemolysin III family protein [Lysobacter pythonis]
MTPPHTSAYSPEEERANVLTHGLGALLALGAGLTMVTTSVARGGNAWQWASAIVFSASMLALYLASTAYHSAVEALKRARLKIVDHCAIYLLIAGTYTPFTLTVLRGGPGWTLFIAIWSLAAVGIVFKLFFTGRFNVVSTLVYIAMGWLVMLYAKPVYHALTGWQFGWLLAGGIGYTLGTGFYLNKRVKYSHALWHLACIAGTVCHFVAVWALVVPD